MMARMCLAMWAVLVLGACWVPADMVGEVDDGVYPPAAYIATTTPVYYGGYPCYWYGGRWYQRYGNGWRGYRQEPGYLHDYRARAPVARQYYGRANLGGVYRHR